jgi:hypothetical protein
MRFWLSIPAGAAVLVAGDFPQITWGSVGASLLVCAVLALAVARSTASGPGLIVILSGLLFGMTWLVNLPEAVLYDVMEPARAVVSLARMLVVTVAAVTVLIAVAGRLGAGTGVETPASPIRSARGLIWRLVAAPAVFILCGAVAGLLIFPLVEPYYEGRVMPDLLAMVSMQVLRALAIVGVAYPLLRTLPRRRDAVLVLALALPVLGVIVPLLPANDLMPPFVRLVHAIETLPYYALYGVLVAVWFGPPRQGAPGAVPPVRAAPA